MYENVSNKIDFFSLAIKNTKNFDSRKEQPELNQARTLDQTPTCGRIKKAQIDAIG